MVAAALPVGAYLLLISNFPSALTINGSIDDGVVSEIRSNISAGQEVIITSHGGKADPSILLAETILKNNIKLKVVSHCLSACAELIIPAASSVEMIDQPLIGFHGNAFYYFNLLKKVGDEKVAQCEVGRTERFSRIYDLKGINKDTWRHQLSRLRIIDIQKTDMYDERGCRIYNFYTKHKYWFPTSKQLSSIFGYRFKGTLCSDDINCMKRRLAEIWYAGDSFVVGDRVIRLASDQ
jgi:hypothetical protein